ncbi:MAG: ATP-binding protein [Thermodesulfobacteriota bacterium]
MEIKRSFKLFFPVFRRQDDASPGRYDRYMFNYGRLWKSAVMLTGLSAIIPLLLVSWVDFNVTQRAVESESLARTSRTVSNAKRTIAAFLAKRKAALDFIANDNSYERLLDSGRLTRLLDNLRLAIGGVTDIGVIDASGNQVAYSGPYPLAGKDYSNQQWFQEAINRGMFISEVFMGFRNEPHFVIAVRHGNSDQGFFVLRISIDTGRLNEQLSGFELSEKGNAFIVNTQGILQTPSRGHEKMFEKIEFPIPVYSDKTEVVQYHSSAEGEYILGYAYIPDSPFILMIVSKTGELMESWHRTRIEMLVYLLGGIVIVLFAVTGFATYFVNRIYIADQRRIRSLHQVEYANKLASIGRLAAGVAHEINNPLAVINEKAGLIKDIFQFTEKYSGDAKLIGLVDSIHDSVTRCGKITKQLLSFARHMDTSVQPVDIKAVISDVLGFLGKEAEYRNITISVDVPPDIPRFESDRGKLQQILLNLINNSFAALSEGGTLYISAKRIADQMLRLQVKDTGCGIPDKDIKRIFEPFFSTKAQSGGTGLGLSITYSLTQELGGSIDVESRVGVGTTFTITLPLTPRPETKENNDETAPG